MIKPDCNRSKVADALTGGIRAGGFLSLSTFAALVAFLGLMTLGTTPSVAKPDKIKVDWSNPEIENFVASRGANRSAAASQLFDRRLLKLELPVLGFEKTLPSVRSSFAVAPRARRSLVMDEKDPVWYEIGYDYGPDVKITVEADLRVQTRLPDSAKLYEPPGGSDADGGISVFDDSNEVGMTGAIAEFTVQKFGGISYTVTVECSEKMKDLCRDVKALRRDKKLLRIISARPPE